MAFIRGANVVTDGLVLALDAANPKSYVSGSTIWRDLSGTSISASLFTSSFNNGSITYNGSSSYANLSTVNLSGSFTINVVFSTSTLPSPDITSGRQTVFADNSGSFDTRGVELSSTNSVTLNNMGVYIIEDYPLPPLSTNTNYYLSLVRTASNLVLVYLNGNRVDLNLTLTELPYLFTIDSIANSLQTRFFSGQISAFSIYNRQLSQEEIAQNVNAFSGRFNFDTTPQSQNIPNTLVALLNVKAIGEGSTFDATMISSSLADLNRLNSLGLFESASVVVTPATYKEGLMYNIKPKKSTYNELLYTQDFRSPGWSFINTSASYGFIAPDGTSTATLFTVTGSGTVRMNQSVALTANHPYNVSWYVSQSNTRYANVIFGDNGEAQTAATQIDFQTQTFYIKNPGSISFNPRNLTLQSLSNSWYRVSYTVTPSASFANYKMTVIPTTSSLGAYATSISSSVYIWGAQITKGEDVLPYQRIVSASTPDSVYTRTTTTTAIDRNGYVSAYPYNLVVNTTNGLGPSGATVERNVGLAPDGTYTADKYTKTGNMQVRMDVATDSVSPHSGSEWNLSFWHKLADTGSNISFSTEIFAVSSSTPLNNYFAGTYTITNQWQRFTGSFSITEPLLSSFSIRPARSSDAVTDNGRSFHIWGVQLTKGSGSLPFQKNTSRLNWPTIDYSAGAPALRTVASTENFFLWSNDFSNTVWSKNNVTVALTSSLSPSGERNSFVLTAVSASGTIKQTRNTSNRVPYFSIYMKRKIGTGNVFLEVGPVSSSIQPTNEWLRYERPGFRISGSYTASAGTYTVTTTLPHGLQLGELQGFGTGTNFTQISAAVTSVTDNFTYVFNSGTTTASGSCTIVAQVGRIRMETQGDEIEIWGPQMSGGDYLTINNYTTSSIISYVKDFVPTTTAAGSRTAESLLIADLSSSISSNSNSGSFYYEFACQNTAISFFTTFELMSLINVSGVKMFSLYAVSTTFPQAFRWRYDPQNIFTGATSEFPLNTFIKMAIVYTTTSLKYFVNGSQIGSTTTLSTPINLTLDKIILNGYNLTKTMAYYPYTLTDSQAIAITS